MNSYPSKFVAERVAVAIVTPDVPLGERIKGVLETGGDYQGAIIANSIEALDPGRLDFISFAMHIVEVATDNPESLSALETYKALIPPGRPVIVISNGLFETTARQFLKLGISDWLPTTVDATDLLMACEEALRPRMASPSSSQARCLAFMSAVGGAGATTLSLTALLAIAGKKRGFLRQCCAVDLDFQHSALAEYADVSPALQLSELASDLGRLDRHLLEIMLSRHSDGLTLLAAPPALDGSSLASPQVIGRLLDLVATDFKQVIVDMPSCWQHWFKELVNGFDGFFIVTEPNVVGLRQAHRLAGMLNEEAGVDVSHSIIVNKRRRFGASVSRQQVQDALGSMFAGFVSDGGAALRRAQDHGVMLASLTSRSRMTRDLAGIIEGREKLAESIAANKPGGRRQ